MASLDKLAIRGIRSFDDKSISTIQFFTPVTVIVGHNGSGKTTIIECLKYATTGDQPPNTRGGAFIHDPKMAHEKEVKAQVKLRFIAANGTKMLAVRNLSVTAKKTAGLTMKTLESILSVAEPKAGSTKRGTISTKCAEMDAEIPSLLGVSKAVLENVIFCHQEDSYWPLAEPAALKKKFDDIFEATKYTKALDSIKALRKDRVAELKADNERLERLSKEKGHSDKLKKRISDLGSSIAEKEMEYESTKAQVEVAVASNAKFYEQATKFGNLYSAAKNDEETKRRMQEDLAAALLNLKHVEGAEAELEEKIKNFNQHLEVQRGKKRHETDEKNEVEEKLTELRQLHTRLVQEKGSRDAAAAAQQQRIQDREEKIKELRDKYGISGFGGSSLHGDQVIKFMTLIEEKKNDQAKETEKIRIANRAKTDEYNTKSTELTANVERFKAQKRTFRDYIKERQSQITSTERSLEDSHTLQSDMATLKGDIEEKELRIKRVTTDVKEAKYDEKLNAKTAKTKELEDKRDRLNSEFRSLSNQADARAKLELKRTEIKGKNGEIKRTVEVANTKFQKIAGKKFTAETIERDVERFSRDKEQELSTLEQESKSANYSLQQTEVGLSSLKKEMSTKTAELKGLEKKLKDGVEAQTTLEQAISDAMNEVAHRKTLLGNMSGTSNLYESLLKIGKQKQVCTACNRHLSSDEMVVFEKFLTGRMQQASPAKMKENQEELVEWESELERLQNLKPVQNSRDNLKGTEIPALEAKIKTQETALKTATAAADEAAKKVEALKDNMKDLQTLKQQSITVARLQKEISAAQQEVDVLEVELSTSGSKKTVAEVEEELEVVRSEIQAIAKERNILSTERDRQTALMRTLEVELHKMQLKELEVSGKITAMQAAEANIVAWKKDIENYTEKLKETDTFLVDAQAPMDVLQAEYQEEQNEFSAKLSQGQSLLQEYNAAHDDLRMSTRDIQRYVVQKEEEKRVKSTEKVEETSQTIADLTARLEGVREVIAKIDQEIHEGGSTLANLRENLRTRKLDNDIKAIQQKIDSYDLEAAHQARRAFKDQYNEAKQMEEELTNKKANLAGQLSSYREQLKTWDEDLAEFKDINETYTEQLIKVKMADMANNDLEKYAKALDNAIMKYHGLKMEEVNDTMRHLWNKTYQGTDIDGIKIRSDVEGGASKRSYNYRVVMTKDQVEMDMRGRCSAGQKMLASIIIRLALSDSFGQNCGILALDEPTNALDTENIDALASSLVDIINERRSSKNFQLIIITHDENFLRKLGQSQVMNNYWRVSRDARQKSVIELQRFN